MREVIDLFSSRLDTLTHFIDLAGAHFDDEEFLSLRIVPDMLPLGTQIAYTCNMPHSYAQWMRGDEVTDLDPEVTSVQAARELIAATRKELAGVSDPEALPEGLKLMEFDGNRYMELTSEQYIHEFLLPNFYFHLVTAYNILRMNGVNIGKANYMAHLAPHVRQR